MRHNIVDSALPTAGFLITRGPDDHFGAVRDTVARRNTDRLTGADATAVYCQGGCTPRILTLWHNSLTATHTILWTDGPLGGGRNLYVGGGYLLTGPLPGDVIR